MTAHVRAARPLRRAAAAERMPPPREPPCTLVPPPDRLPGNCCPPPPPEPPRAGRGPRTGSGTAARLTDGEFRNRTRAAAAAPSMLRQRRPNQPAVNRPLFLFVGHPHPSLALVGVARRQPRARRSPRPAPPRRPRPQARDPAIGWALRRESIDSWSPAALAGGASCVTRFGPVARTCA